MLVGISFVLIDSTSGGAANAASETIYVGISRFNSTGNNLYKSTDGGATFNPVTGGSLFNVVSDYDGFKHTDINQYGQRFTPAMGTTTGIAYAGSNPNVLIRVGSRICYTTNQGVTWTQSPVNNGSQDRVVVSADGATFLHSPNGSALTYYSRTNGAAWTASNVAGSTNINLPEVANYPSGLYTLHVISTETGESLGVFRFVIQ